MLANSRLQRAIALVLLSALLAHLPVSAQDVAPASAAPELVAPAPVVEATTAPAAPSAADVAPVPPTAPFVAPGATEIAWQELHEIQRRQEAVWQPHDHGVGLSAAGVGVGLAVFGVMLPYGSYLVARSREGGDGPEYAEHSRRVGATLITCGLLGLALLVAGSVSLARIHRRRDSRETEMKALSDRRTLLLSAQDVAPAAADSESVAPVQAVELTTAPAAPSAALGDPVRPTLPFVAPGATAIAWQELHDIRRRQDEVWKQRPPSVTLPAVGLAVGLSAFAVMLPMGSIFVASARAGGEASETEHLMRVGAPLIFLGVLGFAALVASATALAHTRRRRVSREAEIKSLTERRTLLENVLEGEWRATRAQRAP